MAMKLFQEELRESTGAGADFPGSAGDRERGKFRPSATPRRTVVAVTGDDGRPVVDGLVEVLNELLLYQKATVLGLSILTGMDLIKESTR